MNDFMLRKIVLNNLEILKKNEFVIYGTGKIAEIYYEFLTEKFGVASIAFFIDNKKKTDIYKGKEVFTIAELREADLDLNQYTYLLGTLSKMPLFIENLKMLNIQISNIIYSTTVFSSDYLDENIDIIDKVILYPEFNDRDKLESIVKEMEDNIVIDSPSQCEIVLISQHDEIQVADSYKIVKKYDDEMDDKTLILVWDSMHLLDKELDGKKNIFCCDESMMVHLSQRMYLSISDKINNIKNKDYIRLSKENYLSLLKKYKDFEYAVVCGMGPSLNISISEERKLLEKGIMIVCNNYVNLDTDLIPDIYVLQDVDYLTNHRDLLDKIINYIKKNGIYLVTDIKWCSIFTNKYKGIEKLIIGLTKLDERINIVSKEELSYKNYFNVIPALCIPLASGLKDTVYITGCDGGDKNSDWKHADGVINSGKLFDKQYLTVGDNHFKNYSIEVNESYKELFEYGERLGKNYIALMDSAFEELHKRWMKTV